MKKFKKSLAIFLTLAMITGLTACNNGGTDSSDTTSGEVSQNSSVNSEEPTEIVFFAVSETLDENQMAEQWAKFEEENNCKISVQFTTASDFKQQYSTLVASGAPLDAMGINIQDIRYLHDSDAVFPLNDYIDINEEDFVEGALGAATWGEDIFAIPYGPFYTSMGLYYNEKLFNELNLEVPKTFEELYAVSDAAREKGYYALTFEGGNLYNWPVWYMLTLGQLVDGDGVGYTEEILKGNAKFTDETSVKAMQALRDLGDHNVWNDGFLGTTEQSAAQALFTSGQALMYCTGSWNLTNMKAVLGDDLNVTTFPLIDESCTLSTQCAKNCPSICGYTGADESKKQLIADFAAFISGAEYQEKVLTERCKGDLSSSYDIPVLKEVKGNDSPILNTIKEEFLPIGQDFLDWYWPPEVNAEFQTQIQAVVSGETTPEEAMEAIQGVYDKLVSEGYEFI